MTAHAPRADDGDAVPPSVGSLLTDARWRPAALGSATALIGFWVYSIVGAVVIYQLTGRALLVGVFTALQFGANLLVSPFVGILLGHIGLRAGMLASTGTCSLVGVVLALAAATDRLSLPLLLSATALTGITSAITTPGLQSLMPRALQIHEVPTAVVIHSGAMTVARAVGPAVAGGWLAIDSHAGGFAFHATAYLAYAVGVARVPLAEAAPGTTGGLARAWRAVRESPSMRLLLGATLLIAWGTDPVNTLLPALAERLGGGDSLVGALASTFGAGALIATAIYPRVSVRARFSRLGGGGLVVLGATLGLVALAPTSASAAVALLVGGAGFVTALTAVTAQLQRIVAAEDRSHVMGLWSAAFIGGRLPASLGNGALTDAAGVTVATAAVGAALVIGGLLLGRRLGRA